jgi:hypothetical protein
MIKLVFTTILLIIIVLLNCCSNKTDRHISYYSNKKIARVFIKKSDYFFLEKRYFWFNQGGLKKVVIKTHFKKFDKQSIYFFDLNKNLIKSKIKYSKYQIETYYKNKHKIYQEFFYLDKTRKLIYFNDSGKIKKIISKLQNGESVAEIAIEKNKVISSQSFYISKIYKDNFLLLKLHSNDIYDSVVCIHWNGSYKSKTFDFLKLLESNSFLKYSFKEQIRIKIDKTQIHFPLTFLLYAYKRVNNNLYIRQYWTQVNDLNNLSFYNTEILF